MGLCAFLARYGAGWTDRRWTARNVEQKDGTIKMCPFVFHRSGEQVVDFRKPWNAAFEAANVPRRIFHDLRRTAVRNMIRAGVDQAIAMSISGHKTVSIFMRYNITSAADKLAALKKTAAHLAAQPKESSGAKVVEITTGSAAAGK